MACVARIVKQIPPADISSLSMSTPFLEMLGECWDYDPLRRPTIGQCLTVVESELTGQLLEVSSIILEGHTDEIRDIAFSPDGALIASGSFDTTLRIWGSESGSLITTLEEGHEIVSLAFSPVGTRIALRSLMGLSIWDVAPEALVARSRSQEWVRTSTQKMSGLGSVAFSPDGGLLACGAGSGMVFILDGSSGLSLFSFQAISSWVYGLAFSPDGRWLASSSWDGTVQVWDAAASISPMTGWQRPAVTLKIQMGLVRSVAFSPNGLFLAVGSLTRTSICIYGVLSWSRLVDFNVGGTARSIAFSPDSTRLACGTGRGDVEIWGTENWTQVETLDGHADDVNSVKFSPDGTRLASCSSDKTVRIWSMKPKTTSAIPTTSSSEPM